MSVKVNLVGKTQREWMGEKKTPECTWTLQNVRCQRKSSKQKEYPLLAEGASEGDVDEVLVGESSSLP